jgi:tetrahydromethanopterin S-methyltransferase subunit E
VSDIIFIEVVVELLIADLIPLLVLAVLLGVLLDGVISEVDVHVGAALERELRGGGADVALGEPVGLHHAVEGRQQHVVPDVELPPLVE